MKLNEIEPALCVPTILSAARRAPISKVYIYMADGRLCAGVVNGGV